MKYIKTVFSFFAVLFISTVSTAQNSKLELSIPLGGNAYSSLHLGSKTITNKGIENWTNPEEYFTVYFRISKPGTFKISTDESVAVSGKSVVEYTINNVSKKVTYNESKKQAIAIGNWKISDTGYVALKIKGISKTANAFPAISKLLISSEDTKGNIAFVPNNEGHFFHWGRRGPSTHMAYQVPEKTNVEWYYNEVTVPKGEDIIGSYYMANGFGEGYFGMQVNSAKERRFLFSVWSPFSTDDPKSIPESHKIKLLKKGKDVHTGEFGNEGSGGQSYLRYNWITGNTYKFLLHGVPQNDNTTIYTAYFFAPELGQWQLMASFSRPQTNTYLKRFHSFLENFIPEQGDFTRKVLFGNQWVCDDKGNWIEINAAKFTIDNTGRKGYRMDYSGGLDNNSFYLRNCGFFNDFTKFQTLFTRPSNNIKPNIDFNSLP